MSAGKVWMRNPDTGGVTIPSAVRVRAATRIRRYAENHYGSKFTRLDVYFRGPFCYVDAFTEPEEPSQRLLKSLKETRQQYLKRLRNAPLHLCRLRYFGDEEGWALGFYTYSHERYELCAFPSGVFYGTPEEAFEIGAVYLQDRRPNSA
jgi:hypothetical protein